MAKLIHRHHRTILHIIRCKSVSKQQCLKCLAIIRSAKTLLMKPKTGYLVDHVILHIVVHSKLNGNTYFCIQLNIDSFPNPTLNNITKDWHNHWKSLTCLCLRLEHARLCRCYSNEADPCISHPSIKTIKTFFPPCHKRPSIFIINKMIY